MAKEERAPAAARNTDALQPAPFFLLRTPHQPVDVLHRWSDAITCSTAAPLPESDETLAPRLAKDRELLRARLGEVLARPNVREAFYVASRSLSERLPKWREAPESKDGEKAEQVIVRYFARMAGRATPFGLFAAFSLGAPGEVTHLEVEAAARARRHVRLDMGYLVGLLETLEREPAVRAGLLYRQNGALNLVAGRYSYPELIAERDQRHYELIAVTPTDALRAALARAGTTTGARREEIANALVDEDTTLEDALAFVDELADAHILESSLTPNLTGGDPLVGAIAALARSPETAATLEAVRARLGVVNEEPVGAPTALYEETAALLAPLPMKVDAAHVFQVDMSRPATATLGPRELGEIARGVRALHALAPDGGGLQSFVKAFTARYGDREVPFPEALDEEVGVGAAVPGALALEPTPLLHGLGLRAKGGGAAAKWSRRDQMLLAKLEEAWSARATSITLTDADLAPLAKAKKDPLPASLAAMVTLLGGRDGRIAMNGWSGASAARLLGRFAAWSPELATALRAHLKDEEGTAPDAVFAEIVHLPDGSRAANILLRPLLREHEIAFCGRSGADPSKTLAVSDLTLSVRRRRVRLFSRTLGREIVPRLSSAHNTATRQLAAYRLLAALQGQGVTSGAAFDWGVLGGAKVLPRVVYGNTILSPQRWRLDEAEVRALSQPTAIGRYRAVAALRARLALPRYVGLQDGDNILPTDLDSSLSVDALVGALKGEKGARLIELDLDAGGSDAACRGPDGTYANELIVPFLHGVPKAAAAATQPGASAATGPALRRSFAPGSEWCVAKMYCPSGAADAVLRDCVAPLVASAIGSGASDGWFFTRDADPDVHLRVHLHGVPARLYGEVLPELEAVLRPLLDAGRARRLVVAPYERAIERDGGDHAVPLLERIHHADSDAALALLRLLEDVPEGKERWAFALLGMHRLLGDFDYVLDARRRVIEAGQRQLETDLALTLEQQRAIADRYRQERPFFAGWLEGRDVPEAVEAAFAARSAAVRPLARALAARKAEGKLVGRFDTLVSNAMNAWVRRMMRARSTHHAAVLHAFLAKHYESVAARSKKAAPKP